MVKLNFNSVQNVKNYQVLIKQLSIQSTPFFFFLPDPLFFDPGG
jgi:hypothetical protein